MASGAKIDHENALFTMRQDTTVYSLQSLVGARLTGVVFVMDYIQLQFDAQVMSVLTLLEVRVEDKAYAFGEEGFRDKICERITANVMKADVYEDLKISINFDDGSNIMIPLVGDQKGNEAVDFRGEENKWWVFHQS
ncbi:MAG: hypothetical protein DWQ07_19565 [Chloroflexi bacterium]|nr:MAG: hypothetical protein DWQ07_19565 [Chloroflexota bacterium]MBL1194281.1 hypothetical protein [Chloroflexota bacterium]NOH11571.1 hypothetical protein [Chloroflexota bacterium]